MNINATCVPQAASLEHDMSESHLVVDGSNIATEGRSDPSLAQLDEAVRAFLADHSFDNVVVVVDATFPNRIDQSERAEYEAAVDAGEILVPPAGTVGRGDAFVLMIAERSGATVLSNDSFQEFHPEHPWLFDDGRLLGGKPVPGVGWVFVDRTPVKGPKSRRATADAKRKKAESSGGSRNTSAPSKRKSQTEKKSPAKKSQAGKKSPAGTQKQADQSPGRTHRSGESRKESKRTGRSGDGQRSRGSGSDQGRKASSSPEPINSPADFLSFITDHQPGATIEAEVNEFTSHGAYAQLEGVRCYIPLKLMAVPAPRSPREHLDLGEVRSFVVQEYDTPRRGIVLALPGVGDTDPGYREHSSSPGEDDERFTNTAPTMEPAEEASVATKKKAPAKKAPAKRKAPAKKK